MTKNAEITIVFDLPDAKAPGFLRRQRRALEFMRKLNAVDTAPDETVVDDLVAFVSDFVTEPEDREVVADHIWDMSQDQFMEVLSNIAGADVKDKVPQANGGT